MVDSRKYINMKNFKNKQSGFIRDIVLTVVALVALKYFFDFDVIGYVEQPIEKGLAWIASKF